MKYLGSKRLIAKHILPVMLSIRRPGQIWVEPFVGGGNMIERVTGPRIGADVNRWAIEALQAIRDEPEKLPKNNSEFTEKDWDRLRSGEWDYKYKGFAGFAYSFGAQWLDSWSRDSAGSDYVRAAYNSAQKQSLKLQGVKLVCASYKELYIPPESFIYCDPPYERTAGYKGTKRFDHAEFWQWCRDMANEGHTVFVSEYKAPQDFLCMREISHITSMSRKNPARTEKLFTYF